MNNVPAIWLSALTVRTHGDVAIWLSALCTRHNYGSHSIHINATGQSTSVECMKLLNIHCHMFGPSDVNQLGYSYSTSCKCCECTSIQHVSPYMEQ